MALIGTLVDTFQTIGSAWTKTGVTASVNATSNQLVISHTSTSGEYNGIISAASYDFTGGSAFVQLLNAGDQTQSSYECQLYADTTGASSNRIWLDVSGNTLTAYKKVSGTQTQIGTGIAYTLASMRWLRLRELSGTLYFEYSADGRTWTTYQTLANPYGTTTFFVGIQAGTYAAGTTGTTTIWDDFNTFDLHAMGMMGIGS